MRLFLIGLVLAMLASFYVASRRQGPPQRCATCGDELPGDLQGDCEHLASHLDTRPVVDRAMPFPD